MMKSTIKNKDKESAIMFYEIRKIISKRGLILWGIFLLLSSLIIPMYDTYAYCKTNNEYYQNMEKKK